MSTRLSATFVCTLVVAGCGRDAGTSTPGAGPEQAVATHSSPPATASGPAAVTPNRHPSESPDAPRNQELTLSEWLVELKSGDASVRLSAVEAIGQYSPKSPQVVPALIKAIEDDGARVRGAAIDRLARFGPASRDAVPALIVALNDTEIDVRWKAAEALGAIGPPAKSAVPALVGALEDEVPNVRSRAGEALLKIDPAAAKHAGVE